MGGRVAGVVEDAQLPAIGVLCGHIDESRLASVECIGIVVAAYLQASHSSGRDVDKSRQLNTVGDSVGHIGAAGQLHALDGLGSNVDDTAQLHSPEDGGVVGERRNLHALGGSRHSIARSSELKANHIASC